MKTIYIFLVFFTTIILFSACHKRQEKDYFVGYENYNRTVGVDGKEIVFLRNYGDDTNSNDTLLKLNILPDALDTTIIVNFYEYFNETLESDINNDFGLNLTSKFFYILPFYEFDNDNDSTSDYKLDTHVSIDFNYPVTTTYFIDTSYYSMLEITGLLYRIKIPRYDEWDDNVWTEFNEQAYPNGFSHADLDYLINGKWNEVDGYGGTSTASMVNWELVPNYSINPENHSITFLMDKTDYMYVICYDASKTRNLKK